VSSPALVPSHSEIEYPASGSAAIRVRSSQRSSALAVPAAARPGCSARLAMRWVETRSVSIRTPYFLNLCAPVKTRLTRINRRSITPEAHVHDRWWLFAALRPAGTTARAGVD